MSETAEIYQRVISKCPAAICPLVKFSRGDWLILRWEGTWTHVQEPIAELIIVGEWLKLLPHTYAIGPTATIGQLGFDVYDLCDRSVVSSGLAPFIALASYLERLPK